MHHELHLQRSKIRLLQIELGELMILVEDVEHHEVVHKRMEKIKEEDEKRQIEEYRKGRYGKDTSNKYGI